MHLGNIEMNAKSFKQTVRLRLHANVAPLNSNRATALIFYIR
jgi:hypothetical protein